MNNNTRVRVRISKDLFESLAKEVLAEAKKASGDHAMKLSKKMPKLGENKEKVNIEPAIIAGQVIGKITEKKVRADLAPKSLEASSKDEGNFSMPA